MNQFNTMFNKSFPIIIQKFLFKNPWYDNELHDLLQKSNTFLQNLEKRNLSTLMFDVNYKKARNQYFHLLQTKKTEYYLGLFKKHKQDIKGTWKVINNILGRKKQSTHSSLKINNQLSSDSFEISNHFNHHFASVASKLVEDLP